ncbi:MAG: energy-coupling factor transporter ATPase [Methanolobus sp.]|uniref:energy-coupling factor transporter ATPase n=1 Tax=Methanolobus sp. TaxID=1874737 RepID=UPI0027316E4C|nr:energy-coupling factor transporter ATPase [Methanolobus sp.]MDP2216609.1 energy-coupling factor transporter ATPase [Methanolobus sp.]
MTLMIEISNLLHSYPDGTPALNSVNLHIGRGEFVVIAGRNGSGKSSLVRHINALLLPSGGCVSVNGLCTSQKKHHPDIRRTVGMVFQNPDSQFVGMTAEEDVAFGPENLGLPPSEIRELVEMSLETLGISELRSHSPRSLSGGQKQKVAIAGVLAMEPECIIFDEVTSMLDPFSRKEVLDTVKRIHAKGTTVIYVTHRLEEAMNADRLVIMDSGRVVADASPRDVFLHHDLEKYGIELPPVVALSLMLSKAGFPDIGLALTKDELLEALCP